MFVFVYVYVCVVWVFAIDRHCNPIEPHCHMSDMLWAALPEEVSRSTNQKDGGLIPGTLILKMALTMASLCHCCVVE